MNENDLKEILNNAQKIDEEEARNYLESFIKEDK